MRILHTSHGGLPDWRIEREAFVAKQHGHQIHFMGLGSKREPVLDVFDSVTMLRSLNNREVVLDKSIREEWAISVREIEPDLIHANDIIAAQFSKNLGIPMVYDDHEYWSAQRIIYRNWPYWKRIAIRPFLNAIPVWEKDILSKHVTITVSEGIAEEHRRHCDNVFVLPNYSLATEVQNLPNNPNRHGIVYVGTDFTRKKFAVHRNMTGLRDHIEFDDYAKLPRDELYIKLTNYRFGLLPFRDTPYSKYISSAKTFDYLNCGLQVLMTRTLYISHGRLPFTYPFDKYSEITNLTRTCERVDPSEIMGYAHTNLVWDAQQDKLFEAYAICMESA